MNGHDLAGKSAVDQVEHLDGAHLAHVVARTGQGDGGRIQDGFERSCCHVHLPFTLHVESGDIQRNIKLFYFTSL
jgi:hypothetical protein